MTTPVNPIVELLVDGEWRDITPDCRQGNADSGGGFEIARGIPNEGNFAEPTQFNFTLNNGVSRAPDTLGEVAVYSPKNPLGPYFGKLGRNQRVRIGYDRRYDSMDRVPDITGGWGDIPDHTHADGSTVIEGEAWVTHGLPGAFSTLTGAARIQGAAGVTRMALLDKPYRDVDVAARFSVTDATSEVGIILRANATDPIERPAAVGANTVDGWTASTGSAIANDASITRGGNSSSIRLTVTASPTVASITNVISAATMWPCVRGANDSYQAHGWVRSSVTTNVRCTISWYKEDGSSFISSSAGADVLVTANTWTAIECVVPTPPQDAYHARLVFQFPSGSGVATGWQLWLSDPEVTNTTSTRFYSVSLVPGTPDILRIQKKAEDATWTSDLTSPVQITDGVDYWIRAQATGQRVRAKAWVDGQPEPGWAIRHFDDRTLEQKAVGRTGQVGLFVRGGTALASFGEVQIDQWRAHTEISKLPPKFDLSRQDHWVPIQSRGILRRLNQGRKSLRSPLTLHLEAYAPQSRGWWPMENDEGDSAGNYAPVGQNATIRNLTFGQPDAAGLASLPGASGIATLSEDDSFFNASIAPHTNTNGRQTLLWFMRLPSLPASTIQIATIYSTGYARTWKVNLTNTGMIEIRAITREGVPISSNSTVMWNGNPDFPTGCWVGGTLYLLQDGGSTDWAFNHHRPGSNDFWTVTGTHPGSVGTFTGIRFNSSAVHTAAGNLQITQVMHYAGDLPFVDYDFREAAMAYDGEGAALRALRLAANARVLLTTTGLSTVSVPMGTQGPSKLMELLEEAGEADDGFVIEERDEFGLTFVTRNSRWNRESLTLDIDAGHLSAPLEADSDDQQVRNDVTISRPGGSSRRAIKTAGALNINEPEDDPDGVGTYDEQKPINVGTDDLCGSHAEWRVSRGTQDDPRYPSLHANMMATAYRADPRLAADLMATDVGDALVVVNTEADYAPRRQDVQSYTETIRDLYEMDLTFTSVPGGTREVGVVGYSTRIGTQSIVTAADFVAGTDTELLVTSADGRKFVTLEAQDHHWPFEVEVAGVRLNATMTGVVLNTNTGFESGTSGWDAVGGATIAADRFNPKEGVFCLRATATGAGVFGVAAANTNAAAVTVGQQYRISGWVKSEETQSAEIAMDWYSSTPTFLSASIGQTKTASSYVWTWFTGVVTAPASAATGRIRVSSTFAGATRIWFDSLRVTAVSSEAGDPQTLVVDQEPTNSNFGVSGKNIPAGSPVTVVGAMHVGWGTSQ